MKQVKIIDMRDGRPTGEIGRLIGYRRNPKNGRKEVIVEMTHGVFYFPENEVKPI